MKFKTLALLAAVLMTIATIAYAATPTAVGTAWVAQDTDGTITFPATTTNGPTLSFKPSANVKMAYDSAAGGQTYSVGAYHTSGVKAYATSSGDSKIYMLDFAAGGTPGVIPAVATVGTATQWGTGWSALK
jgi:hypothetical protein